MLVDAFASVALRFQAQLYYIIMAFARFNLYGNSYSFLYKRAFDDKKAKGGKWTFYVEVIAVMMFWTWYGCLLYNTGSWHAALGYFLVSHIVPSPLHVQVRLQLHLILSLFAELS